MDEIRANRVQGVLSIGLPLRAVEWMSAQGVALVAFGGEGPASVNLSAVDMVSWACKRWHHAVAPVGVVERTVERAMARTGVRQPSRAIVWKRKPFDANWPRAD
jgi:shikimate kinase